MNLQNYPGAKTNSGIIPFMVNQIPHHKRYFELFAGSAQLFRNKKRAEINYLNDVNPLIVEALFCDFGIEQEQIRYSCLPLIQLLAQFAFSKEDFMYLDPPYPKSARRSGATIYKHEMLQDTEHEEMLQAAKCLQANIMISSRPNQLYDQVLKTWRRLEFETMGRRGKCVEVIYMNYDLPDYLHQYDMLGDDCWQRQQIDRIRERFTEKINRIPPHQRHIMIEELIKKDFAAVKHFITVAADTGENNCSGQYRHS